MEKLLSFQCNVPKDDEKAKAEGEKDGVAVASTVSLDSAEARGSAPQQTIKDQDQRQPTVDAADARDSSLIAARNVAAYPASISAWMNANMPTRPIISAEFEARYPVCAANLRTSVGSNAFAANAAQCRSDLENHKSKYVLDYYKVKVAYDAAIKTKQTELSRRGLNSDEIEIYNFLQSENEDLNYREGKSWNAIVAAETRINDDIEFCRAQQ